MNAISTMQLSILDNLFIEKERELKRIIGDLQLIQVKSDSAFDATLNRIKNSILLSPVIIGEPKITGNRQITKQVPPNYQNMWGGPQNRNVISISFPFTGSEELFNHRAGGQSLAMNRIYLPSYRSIDIEVELKDLDKSAALSMATAEIATTRELINQNNPVVENWSIKMIPIIEQMAANKRKELIDFYS